MRAEFSPEDIQRMKDEADESIKEVIDALGRDHPKVVDAAAAAVGSTLGGGASFAALYFAGTAGLSAAGITSGLATAGALVGGGMVVGVGVLAAPVAVLGIAGYAIAKKRRDAKLAAALDRAIEKLYAIQERLMANAEYLREQLAVIKAFISQFENQRMSLKIKKISSKIKEPLKIEGPH